MSDIGHASSPEQVPALRRVARRANIHDAVILADCSFSMDDRDEGPSGPRRIDRLAEVLGYVLTRVRVSALIAFNDFPSRIELAGRVMLPDPVGGTALELALDAVDDLPVRPARVIVISDGWPNEPEKALASARRLSPAIIDAYYVGPEGDASALAFMARLSACGGPGGMSGRYDLARWALIAERVVLRLTGPQP